MILLLGCKVKVNRTVVDKCRKMEAEVRKKYMKKCIRFEQSCKVIDSLGVG